MIERREYGVRLTFFFPDEKVASEKARDSFLSLDIPQLSRSPKLFRVRNDGLFFCKEILIKPLELDSAANADAHAIFNHQVSQPVSVYQDDPLGKVFDIVPRMAAEGRGGDEHALGGAVTDQAANEGLYIGAADCRVGIAFGLHIDPVQPQPILVDLSLIHI